MKTVERNKERISEIVKNNPNMAKEVIATIEKYEQSGWHRNMEAYKRKVHYYETDQMGIVHHSNYIRWFEEARIDFLEKIGKQTIKFNTPPTIVDCASIVGPKESGGPLAKYFDQTLDDEFWGEKTWEKAESKIIKETVNTLYLSLVFQ